MIVVINYLLIVSIFLAIFVYFLLNTVQNYIIFFRIFKKMSNKRVKNRKVENTHCIFHLSVLYATYNVVFFELKIVVFSDSIRFEDVFPEGRCNILPFEGRFGCTLPHAFVETLVGLGRFESAECLDVRTQLYEVEN